MGPTGGREESGEGLGGREDGREGSEREIGREHQS